MNEKWGKKDQQNKTSSIQTEAAVQPPTVNSIKQQEDKRLTGICIWLLYSGLPEAIQGEDKVSR